jgi:hypothetical protein
MLPNTRRTYASITVGPVKVKMKKKLTVIFPDWIYAYRAFGNQIWGCENRRGVMLQCVEWPHEWVLENCR